MKQLLITAGLWVSLMLPTQAATPAQVDELSRLIGLPEIIDVMREEGLKYGNDIATDMFPNRAGGWPAQVDRIYDGEWMATVISQQMQSDLKDTDVTPLIDYFSTPLGSQIITLEVSARVALMDQSVEDATMARVEQMVDDNEPRLLLIDRYIEANDLLESNIVGSLNSNFAFFAALADGGGLPGALTQDEMLRDVWSQEPEIRTETQDWLYAFLTLAYQPLTDAELETYIALSETPAGQDMNRALFTSFDLMFEQISAALGGAAAEMMAGEDL